MEIILRRFNDKGHDGNNAWVKQWEQRLKPSGFKWLWRFIVTCLYKHSRNRQLGQLIGEGKALEDITLDMSMIAEVYLQQNRYINCS